MTPNIVFKYFPNLSKEQREQIEKLSPLYREWNAKINVISRKDEDNIYLHHILHSLAIAKYLNSFLPTLDSSMHNAGGVTVMDVGCGGGFPGIPLAILYPKTNFILADSIGKKIKVAQSIAEEIGLKNVTALHGRAEEVNLKEYTPTGKVDLVVSRAVTSLVNFIPWVKGKYTKGIICLKGGDIKSEIDECVKRLHISPSHFFTKDITDWFEEDYFQEKKVLYSNCYL